MLNKYAADFDGTNCPIELLSSESPLEVRRFSEAGNEDISMFMVQERNSPPGPSALLPLGLTAREAEVLYWIAQGKSNPDISIILTTSVLTIHKHLENIFRKLGLETSQRGCSHRPRSAPTKSIKNSAHIERSLK